MSTNGAWWTTSWFRNHVSVAPVGILVTTYLLSVVPSCKWYIWQFWQSWCSWGGWVKLDEAASLVDLGIVVYAVVAVLAERTSKMIWWSLAQKKQWEESKRQEGRQEGRQAVLTQLEQIPEGQRSAEVQRILDEGWREVNGHSQTS